MASDLFGNLGNLSGGLGGLMKGLSNLMPSDDPNTQLVKLQSEVSDLRKQETDIYTDIGRKAVQLYGLDTFADVADRMRLIQANLAAAEEKLNSAKSEKEARDNAAQAAKAERTCPQCGHVNPEGTKFCQDCGTRLGAQNICSACGAANPVGVRFCQDCGNRLQAAASAVCPACGMENAPGTRFCGGCGAKLEV